MRWQRDLLDFDIPLSLLSQNIQLFASMIQWPFSPKILVFMAKTTLNKLLAILSDGQYHSGEDIGAQLGITRSAIWKLVQQLKAMQVDIQAKTNQGYCIPGGLELLSIAKIKKHLADTHYPLLKKTIIFDSISSTNDYLLNYLRQHNHNAICLAEVQTAGRGRFGRLWYSPFGKNIYFSLLWHFKCDISELSGLSLVVGATILSALKDYGVTQGITLKWPNDILFENQKLCGTLIELVAESNHHCAAIIGIGINLELPQQAHQFINQAWTDLTKITQQKINRNQLIAFLINHLAVALPVFEQQGLKPLVKQWRTLDKSYQKPVQILFGDQVISGINQGIDERGRFLLEDAAGHSHAFSSGEVSLLKQSL